MSPQESKKLRGKCPVCRRPLTRGVEERVEELADRSSNFKPNTGAIDFVHLLPLHTIIGTVLGIASLSALSVWKIFNSLTSRFGNEYAVLLDVSKEELEQVVDPRIADAIIKVRRDAVTVIPGYDGVYGKLSFLEEKAANQPEDKWKNHGQTNLEKFI